MSDVVEHPGRTGRGKPSSVPRVLFGLVGLAGAALVVHFTGSALIWSAILGAVEWMPLALAIEGARIAVEAEATRQLYGHLGGGVPRRSLYRAQLLAYSVFVLVPAGRAASEATKAGMLGAEAGRMRAAAVASVAQGVALLGTGVTAIACALAASAREGGWDLALVLWINAAAVIALGGLLLFAIRRRSVGKLVAKVLGWLGTDESQRRGFRSEVKRIAPIPWRALAGFVASRALSVAIFFVLLVAVGAGPAVGGALRAMGVSLLGAAALDLVPADLGLTEGAFVLFAHDVGIDATQGVAIGVLFHVIQLTWVLFSALAALVWRPQRSGARQL